MAMCPQCEGEMMGEISCLSEPISIGGDFFEPIRWGDERKRSRWVIDFPCRDCRTPVGGVHHPGCCVERCPACLGQALGCPCFGTDGDDDDDLDDLDDVDGDARDARDPSGRSGRSGRNDGADEGDLATHVRISLRCRAHLFHRYFRK